MKKKKHGEKKLRKKYDGGAGDHLGWLKISPMLPSAVLHHLF
jgi:hypothetical protein